MKNQVYKVITDQIIEKLESGAIPWRKPWRTGKAPANFKTRKPYRGINAILLGMQAYNYPYWLMWNQIKDIGGSVSKGEHASSIIFWKDVEIESEEEQDNGGVEFKARRIPFVRFYRVWNLDQTEGIGIPAEEEPGEENEPLPACEVIAEGMPNRPNVTHKRQSAYYDPSKDYINKPRFNSFEDPQAYYATLFHELVHSTGHKSRLDRLDSKDRDSYSKEELIAEVGAAFLCAEAGIQDKTLDNSASNINGWLKVLKKDKRILLTAASAAQRAVDYILGCMDRAEDSRPEEIPCPLMKRVA